MGVRSFPSMMRSAGNAVPVRAAQVGSRSMVVQISSEVLLAGMVPGHQAMVGSRMPPSRN